MGPFAPSVHRFPRLSARAGARAPSGRRLAALGILVLMAWAQVFFGVHELHHVGQADASACKLALVASTLGSSGTAAAPHLLAPAVTACPLAPLPLPTRELAGTAPLQQARAPPALA